MLLMALAAFLVVVLPAVLICRRLGFSPYLGILAGLPLVNLVLLWFLAVARWPAHPSNRPV